VDVKLAANLNTLWAELPYDDRFLAAAQAGFDAVAVPVPYVASTKETQRAALRAGVSVIQISAPPPNYTGGARGFAAVPGLQGRFQYDLRRALRYCDVLNVPMLHIMAGVADGPAARAALLDNLRHAVGAIPEGITLTLQPQAQDGAFLNDYAVAAEIIEAVGVERLGLQFHSQHAQALHGDACAVFDAYAPLIRHVQIGDTPGGGAPGTGRIDFDALFGRLAHHGYDGWVVADYSTEGRTEDSLGWMPTVPA
jgi:hydroxypyruvate isomerase